MTILKNLAPIGKFTNLSHTINSGDHLVHIYDDKKTLRDAVCNFIIPALTSNQGIVIVASSENIKMFESYLESRALDVAKAKLMGQLVVLDAKETLKLIMTDNRMDPIKFVSVIGSVLTALSQSYTTVRAYGEMVSVLWNSGQEENAIELEKLWTELAKFHHFSLLCGYKMENLDSASRHPCFNNVCHSHTHLITKDGNLKVIKK